MVTVVVAVAWLCTLCAIVCIAVAIKFRDKELIGPLCISVAWAILWWVMTAMKSAQ